MWLIDVGTWRTVRDGYGPAFALFQRHYSYRAYADGRRDDPSYRNRRLFVGPGEKMVLITPDEDALFAWRKFVDDSGWIGVCCCVFHNESNQRGSDLILAAEAMARKRWPTDMFYTFVNAERVRRKRDPGRCFRKAGWDHVASTRVGRLMVFTKWPAPRPSGRG